MTDPILKCHKVSSLLSVTFSARKESVTKYLNTKCQYLYMYEKLEAHARETARLIDALPRRRRQGSDMQSASMKRYWRRVKEGRETRFKKPSRFLIRVIDKESKTTKSFALPMTEKLSEKLEKVVLPDNYYSWKWMVIGKDKRELTETSKIAYLLHETLKK